MASAFIDGINVCRYVWIFIFLSMANETLKYHQVLNACWDKGFFVEQHPMGRGWSKKPYPVQLVMDLQGQKKMGEDSYEQNSKALEEKIEEMYRYIHKRFIH